MATFRCLTPLAIKDEIAGAARRASYAAPGLTEEIASSLIRARDKLGADQVNVILDLDPEVCRLGYGTIDGITLLQEKNVPLRKAPGLRIGILVIDDRGWVFSTPALLIEEIRNRDNEPNAVAVTEQQAAIMLRAISPGDAGPRRAPTPEAAPNSQPEEPPLLFRHSPPSGSGPEVGNSVATRQDIEAVRQDLDQNPPQSFRIARKVRVFNAAIEFVELELIGAQIQRHTVSLPKSIFEAIEDETTKNRINAAYKLIDPAGALSGRTISHKVNALRKDALKSIPHFGQTINRKHRDKFQSDVEKLRAELKNYQTKVRTGLEANIAESKNSLIKALVPPILNNPPRQLMYRIAGEKPTADDCLKFLEEELDRVFPSADSLIADMELRCRYKAVTYDTLIDPKFREHAKEAYPELEQLFEEYDAAKARETTGPANQVLV